jgi:GT2 family glycosyltransferase
MSTPRITVAIINFNTKEELRNCLRSLAGSSVIVYDNNSSDGSTEMARTEFPDINVIEGKKNLGYGAAANRSIQGCSSEYLIVSNSDVLFPEGATVELAAYLDQNPRVGVLGPRLLNADGTLQPSCFVLPGSLRWLVDNDVVCSVFRRWPAAGKQLLRAWNHDEERDVPWVKGAVLAIRRAAFEEAGGFDERFFMYYEETDLCLRVAQYGWAVRFAPVIDVVHLGGVSTGRVRAAMTLELFFSLMRFANIHYSRFHCFLLQAFWKGILLFRWLRDRIRLLISSDTQTRERLENEIHAWARALRWSFGVLSPHPSESAASRKP